MALREQPWWIRIFVALGILATMGAVVTLFFALGRRPPRMWATEAPAAGTRAFLTALAGSVGSSVEVGGQVQFLPNGDRMFPALLHDLRQAQKTIHFTVFIWEKGKLSDRIADVLIERARAGVAVRLLLDSLGAVNSSRDQMNEMKAAGVHVQMFREARLGRFTRYHRRTHRRAIVIDGKIGYTGGAAIADKWMGDARHEKEWRDDLFRVTGPMAASLQTAFAELWTGSGGEILVGDAVWPAVDRAGTDIVHIPLASSPVDEKHPLRVFFGMSFLGARQKLYVASSYFVPDAHTRRFVMERAKAGVDVRLLVPSDKTDAGPIRQATHYYLDSLLAAGVRVWEFQPTMMHSKYVIVDGKWSVVGSANMDVRSKELNSENVLGILDTALARELEAAFLADLRRSKEILLGEWRKRGAWKRLQEQAWVLFVEQY
jgi:cardiolipin synthase